MDKNNFYKFIDMISTPYATIKNEKIVKDTNQFIVLNKNAKYDYFFKVYDKNTKDKIFQFLEDNKENNNLFICLSSCLWNEKHSRKSQYTKFRNVLCFDFDSIDEKHLQDENSIKEYLNQISPKIYDECCDEEVSFFEYFEPKFIVMSGHGFHIYYELEKPIYCNSDEWNTYLKAFNLFQSLFSCDARPKDKARLIRLPLSINQKENKPKIETKLYYNDFSPCVSLNDFIDTLVQFGAIPIVEQEKISNTKKCTPPKKKIKIDYNYELTQERKDLIEKYYKGRTKKTKREMYKLYLHTFEKLIEIRNKENITQGYRNHLIMTITRININNFISREAATDIARAYNNMFLLPLEDEEVLNIVNDIYSRQEKVFLKFKSAFSIQEFLEITPTEQDELGYAISFFKEIDNYKSVLYHRAKKQEEKTREILLGIPSNKELKREYQFKILEDNPSSTNEELQELLQVSRATLFRLKNEYKEYKLQMKKRA